MNRIVRRNTNPADREDSFFYNLFQHSMIGQVVVDNNMDILFANDQILDYFQSKIRDPLNLSFIEVFRCAEYKSGCRKCGETENCKNCGIWSNVRQILFQNACVQDVIHYTFQTGRCNIRKWFQLKGVSVTWHDKQYAFLAFIDISEMKQKERDLKVKLTLDLATGTLNKVSLLAEIRRLAEPGPINSFTICMIDFDHFKRINDRYGHLMGDRILEVFSDIAHSYTRSKDLIGRYGGEEFVFVFCETDQKQALQILNRIHGELEEHFSNKIELPVTFSAGAIYVESINSLTKYTDLIDDVDKLLYRAKKHGRGRAISSMGETIFSNTF